MNELNQNLAENLGLFLMGFREEVVKALEGKHKVQDSLISAVKVNLSKSESIRGLKTKESEV